MGWTVITLKRLQAWKPLNIVLAMTLPLSSGCTMGFNKYWYFTKPSPQQEHYREVAAEIDYPNVTQAPPEEVEFSAPPRTVANTERDEVWDVCLEEIIHIALANSDIIRSSGQFLSPGNSLLTNPLQVASIYDPAIQESGVLFGNIGVEAALADFDATWSTNLLFSGDETIQNNAFFGNARGSVLDTDSAAFNTGINKPLAYGANFRVNHEINYQSSNAQGLLFPSVYTGNVEAEYRQQLLAGSGAEFARVAGPLSTQFASITGVSNGILIARINGDISITNFEANVRNLVKDVEDLYWDLYLAYRNFDTSVTARNTALDTWRVAKAKRDLGGVRGFTNSEESQARDRYFETRAQAENALGTLYVTEQRLREVSGMPVNDRRVIRPSDAPVAAPIHTDWYHCLAEALTERVELRRQKWNIKSIELQLTAAKNFARPRLDFISRYRVNGFGDNLLVGGGTARSLDSFYGELFDGTETGYDVGFEFSMPFGLRQAKTQVQNLELRLTKARKVLAAQELEVGHELAVSFQQLETNYATAVSNFSRREAALERVKMIGQELQVGSGSNTLDRFLRAQESLAAAENAYHQSLVDYNKAIVDLYFRKGTLLDQDGIHLAEGKWHPEAYKDAFMRAKSRAHAIPAPHLRTVPPNFAADGHLNQVGFAAPEAQHAGENYVPADDVKLSPMPEEIPLPLPSEGTLKDPGQNNGVPAAPGEAKPEATEEKARPYFEGTPDESGSEVQFKAEQPGRTKVSGFPPAAAPIRQQAQQSNVPAFPGYSPVHPANHNEKGKSSISLLNASEQKTKRMQAPTVENIAPTLAWPLFPDEGWNMHPKGAEGQSEREQLQPADSKVESTRMQARQMGKAIPRYK